MCDVACRAIIKNDITIARALLPHIVSHLLQFGTQQHADQILVEINAVLRAVQPPSAALSAAASVSAASASASAASAIAAPTAIPASAQMAAQAVFQLLDVLSSSALNVNCPCPACQHHVKLDRATRWPWLGPAPPPLVLDPPQKPLPPPPPLTSAFAGDGKTKVPVPLPPRSPIQRCIVRAQRSFIDTISLRALANAAYACKAYTRALRYLESLLRDVKDEYERRVAVQNPPSTPAPARPAPAPAARPDSKSRVMVAALKRVPIHSDLLFFFCLQSKKKSRGGRGGDDDSEIEESPAVNNWSHLKFRSAALFDNLGAAFTQDQISFLQNIYVST